MDSGETDSISAFPAMSRAHLEVKQHHYEVV